MCAQTRVVTQVLVRVLQSITQNLAMIMMLVPRVTFVVVVRVQVRPLYATTTNSVLTILVTLPLDVCSPTTLGDRVMTSQFARQVIAV